MKKFPIAIAIAIVTLTFKTIFAQTTGSSVTAAASVSIPICQPQFPLIISQPDDQCVAFSSNATFSVTALNANGYQWLFNGNVVTNGTNSSLVIQNVGIQNVGYYSCDVLNGPESVPTRSAMLQVFTNSIDPQTGVDPVVVYSFPILGNGSGGSCPGPYQGYVVFQKPYNQGWGWGPDTTNGNTVFTASDGNQTNTKVQYMGAFGDMGCNQTAVTIPNPAFSPVYRFTIYFTNSAPTNAYPITLSGFNP